MLFNKTAIKKICNQRQSNDIVEIINNICKAYLQRLITGVVKITYYCNRKTISINDIKVIFEIMNCRRIIYTDIQKTLTLYKPFDTYVRSLIGDLRLSKGVSKFLLHIIENKIQRLFENALFLMKSNGRETLISKDFIEQVEYKNIDFSNKEIGNELLIKYIEKLVLLTKYAGRITIDCTPVKILTYLWAESKFIDYGNEIWEKYEKGEYKNKNIKNIKNLITNYKYQNQKIGLTGLIYLSAIIEKIIYDKYDKIFFDFLFI